MNRILHKKKLALQRAMPHSQINSFGTAKPAVNKPGDIYEQEADAMAARVVQTQPAPAGSSAKPVTGLIGQSVQRKCAHCEEEEKKVMRKASTGAGGTAVSSSFASTLQGSKGVGSPLPAATRGFMENAFSADFSRVKVHTGHTAAGMNESVGARAFTYGNDIYFNEGQYNPGSYEGKQLLAHELTHTLQQGGSGSMIQRESVYEDVAGAATRTTDANGQVIYTGSVERSEYRNETDRAGHTNQIHRSNVGVTYNESTCQLTVPLKIRFVNQTAANRTTCGDINGVTADPTTPVSTEVFDDTRRRFLQDIPGGLNGWYKVVLGGDSCSPCREVPVTVVFTEVTSGEDKTVIVTGNSGRSYVSGDDSTIALCSSSGLDTEVMIHEGGHFALGTGDEYHEGDGSRPVERERPGEYSRMAQDAPGRLLEFHDRHFNFALAFLRSIYPACSPRLERTRTGGVEFTIPFRMFGMGSYSPSGTGDFGISLGLQMGIPLMDMRRLSLMVGPEFSFLAANREFLAGVRAGIEGRLPLGFGTSIGLNVFGQTGAGFDFSSGSSPTVGAYAGGGAGIHFRFLNNSMLVGVEGGTGVWNIGLPTEDGRYWAGAVLGGSM